MAESNNPDDHKVDGDLSEKLIEEAKKLAIKPKHSFKDKYDFWDTQPVLKINEIANDNHAIEENKDVSEIRTESYSLPESFYWDDVSLENESQLSELYTLLNENYVEDDDNMFRFDYSPEFLKWALMPPGWRPEWFAGIRVKSNKKLVGFIGAVPSMISVYDKNVKMVEINFLCVHKKLRSKRVAPVLIREITRRVNKQGIFQAVYTGGVLIPKPVATCMYWHRSINPKKLIECHFSQLSSKMTMKRTIKLYKLPETVSQPGLRPLTEADLEQAHKLLMNFLAQFPLHPVFETIDDFRHWFLPRNNVVHTFVLASDPARPEHLTDLTSFYSLPSSVINNHLHQKLYAAYSFYNVSRDIDQWSVLMKDALVRARDLGYDVFNSLDVMHNKQFMKELKFGPGDGQLHYYLYNWRCPAMASNDVALVLQ